MSGCEFCDEFGTAASNRFRDLYRGIVSSRIVARTDNFVVIPTLGQLLQGSLLVLPVSHVETCAALDRIAREELSALVREVSRRVSMTGEPLVFEHGAHAETGGSCGIYHAHLHVVPLPRPEVATSLFPEHGATAPDLDVAWEALAGSRHYLLLATGSEVLYRDVGEELGRFPSQFFRRRIAERFDLPGPWNWRSYDHVEPALLRTLTDHRRHAR